MHSKTPPRNRLAKVLPEEWRKKLVASGADVQPPVDEGWGGRFITLEDPDKYRYFFVTWDT